MFGYLRTVPRFVACIAPSTLLLMVAASLMGQATNPPAIVNIEPNVTTPLPRNFSGVNADLNLPVEYWDYRFNTLAEPLGFGWVRFPGGTSSDIYNWQTGEDEISWWQEFPASSGVGGNQDVIWEVIGRGGAKLIDAANRANMLGAPLIICVNGYTDTYQSAALLAKFVKENNIQVAAWELSNEPYLYEELPFWNNAAAYLDKMYPYYQAIHSVDPDALISIFLSGQGYPGSAMSEWDQEVGAYSTPYWNALSFHSYPNPSGDLETWIEDERAALVTQTGDAFISQLTPFGPKGVKFLNTEFDSSLPEDSTPAVHTDGTLWGGVYAAEYIMRMSQTHGVQHVGPSEISYQAGVFLTDTYQSKLVSLGKELEWKDTLKFDFGPYLGAQGVATSVLNNVLKDAVESNQTTVTGSPMVPATGISAGVPAIYAMSYTSRANRLSTVITNKSASAQQVTIEVNGTPVPGSFPVEYVCASKPTPCKNDPASENTPNTPKNQTNQTNVTVQNGTASNPVNVPAYSVMRVDVETPSVLTFLNEASMRNPGTVYQWTQAAPDELVVAILPAAKSVLHLFLKDSSAKVVKVDTFPSTPTEVGFIVPEGLAPGPISVSNDIIDTPKSLTGRLELKSAVPGIYSANRNGAGVAWGYWSPAPAPTPVFDCNADVPMSCLPLPVPAGAFLQLVGTGFRSATHVKAFVAGEAATVTSFGAWNQIDLTDFDQVTLTVPASLTGAGNVSVYIVADGQISNMTTIEIQ